MPIPILQRFRAAFTALVVLAAAAPALCGAGATTLYLSSAPSSGVTPAGMTFSTGSTGSGWTPTATLGATTNRWYGAAQNLSIPAGTWNVVIWTSSPGAASTQRVDILKVAADGSASTVLGSATLDINATGMGNHPSTFAIALGAQSLASQRIVVAITKTAGADATMAFNGNDFPTRLEHPAGSVTPLVITQQPANQTVNEGQTATFTVGASASNGTLTYQWFKGSPASYTVIAGATSASYTTPATTLADNNQLYHVIVKSPGAISLTSYNAKVTVKAPVVTITQQPKNVAAVVGKTATLSVGATSTNGVLTYQWYKGKAPGVAIAGATSATYTTPVTTLADSGTLFYVVVGGNHGAISRTSYNCRLTVNDKVTITQQPVSRSVTLGQTATFSVTATTANGTLTYQWYKGIGPNGVAIAGATSASYTTPATQITDNATYYYVIVKGSAGVVSAMSYNAKLTVTSNIIIITTQPASKAVTEGATATFSVAASSPAAMTYQWYKGASSAAGTLISGATSASYTTPATTLADNGTKYCVKVSSVGYSPVDSTAATLTVNAANPYAWNEEFDGPGIDSSKWTFDIGNGNGGWGNGEWETYTSAKDNVSIANGNLVITARKEDFAGFHFTSARMLTRGKYSFKHGRIEARIKFPTGGNMIWPCFWMLGDTSVGWPKTNEIDIAEMFGGSYSNPTATFGDDTVSAHCFWWQENSFADPLGAGNYADYGLVKKLSSNLSTAYRIYALERTATTLKAYVWEDGLTFEQANPTPYWTMTIDGQGLEELDNPDYLLLNFAIGQPQWGMTSVDQAAPLPQSMYVDYVRVSDIAASGQTPATPAVVIDKVAIQPHGKFGVMPDATVCDAQLDFTSDANVYLWNNLTGATPSRANATAVTNATTSWWGLGVATTARHNLVNYAGGSMHLAIKTNSTDTFKIGIHGGDNGDAWVTLTNGGSKSYDFPRDNQWHDITIPMTAFGGADFTDLSQFFMVVSEGTVTAGRTYEFDDIYFTENEAANITKPVGTKYGILTGIACDAGVFNATTDGAVNNWNTANGTIGAGSLGAASSLSFAAPAAVWYGMGIAANKLYDLSAFANGHLHFSLKVAAGSSTAKFKLGLKGPGGQSVRESWIKMGSADYPILADGAFHDFSIPASEFCNTDLAAVSQLFMVAGENGPMTMEIANIYWSSN